jgi:hypothetical protein
VSEDQQPGPEQDIDAELDAALSKLTTLQLVRVFIERLAEDLPVPGPGLENTIIAMSLLGQRAKSLYANFQYSLDSPVEIGSVLAIRPLVELVILAKWLTLDPELHMFLYLADSDASEVAHMKDVREHAKMRGSTIPEDPNDPTRGKEATRDAAFAKLKDLGKSYGKGRIMPNLRRMADEVISRVPGHKGVMNDAYVYAYKTFSPWEHTEASSFKATANETGPNKWEWLGDRSAWHPEDLEAIASAMYAYVLETVFATLGDGDKAVMARQLRDHIIRNHVRSDRVQPPSDKPDGSEVE